MRTSLENIPAIIQNRRPLKFGCKECNQPIIVKYLHYGEKAKCGNCGLLNIVPETAVETSEQPDYARDQKMAETREGKIAKPKKFLSPTRVTSSAMLGAVLTAILQGIEKNPNSLKHFIMAFAVAYMVEYLMPSKVKTLKLRQHPARSDHICYVCDGLIKKGEICYSRHNLIDLLTKSTRNYCHKCYTEIFYSPEALSAARKEQVKPKGKFKLFPG